MRTQRTYKVVNDNGLVGVAKCSSGIVGSISAISDTEYRLTQVAAHLANGGAIDSLGDAVNQNLDTLKANVFFSIEDDTK